MKTGRNYKMIGILLTILILTVTLTGCGSQSEQAGVDNVIRVGYFPNMTHAQALVGLNDGSFKKLIGNDIKIEEHIFNAGPAEIEALLAGEIDLGYIGPVPAINGFVKSGGELRIVAGAADAGAVLVARKGADIRTIEELKGKKVAVPQLGNTQDISLRNLLSQAGLKDASKGGSVTVIPAENPDILTLIAKGDVDAALVPEPWGSRITKQTDATVILDADKVWRNGKYATAVVIVSTKFLNKHPDLVEKWLTAHIEITRQINQNRDKSKAIINSQIEKLTKKSLPVDVLNSSFSRITVTYDPEIASVRDFVKLSVDNGYLKKSPDVSNLFDLSVTNKVLQKKGLPLVQ